LRGWIPGDRIRLGYGTKKLKKLLAEARVPEGRRKELPVLCDARGRVLWVAGVATSVLARSPVGEPSFFLGIEDVLQR
jgi:tRNA(Ile)-lysidine synthase